MEAWGDTEPRTSVRGEKRQIDLRLARVRLAQGASAPGGNKTCLWKTTRKVDQRLTRRFALPELPLRCKKKLAPGEPPALAGGERSANRRFVWLSPG